MTLRKDEYMIKGDSIILPKKTLERLKTYYYEVLDHYKFNAYYKGKIDTLTDLLKLFEPLEG